MNKKLIVALAVVIVLGGATWAYFATRPNASAPQNNDTSTADHPSSEGNDINEAAVESSELTYTDEGFTPQNLSVKMGTTIKIMNKSSGPLQFSSDDHPTHTKHPEFNLMTIQEGQEETLELKTAGTWGYHNHLKAQDMGTITVKE